MLAKQEQDEVIKLLKENPKICEEACNLHGINCQNSYLKACVDYDCREVAAWILDNIETEKLNKKGALACVIEYAEKNQQNPKLETRWFLDLVKNKPQQPMQSLSHPNLISFVGGLSISESKKLKEIEYPQEKTQKSLSSHSLPSKNLRTHSNLQIKKPTSKSSPKTVTERELKKQLDSWGYQVKNGVTMIKIDPHDADETLRRYRLLLSYMTGIPYEDLRDKDQGELLEAIQNHNAAYLKSIKGLDHAQLQKREESVKEIFDMV